ncbi:hypothetical protein GJ688_04770 [Heliobacillus mobilis]|uniref:Lysozyme n=1 Tax=Heliobacterium mobile TaxID=28064 RepID=A0A6I3SHJ3_HELMO|nr:glycoside hydrolase family 25 protein [Heliobacterium mobile]MTV48296.1 hypothetical protein [Heliobacterium mobile]
MQNRSDSNVLGIDVSSYQGTNIDWNQVREAGISFAYVKATEGCRTSDQCFQLNVNNSQTAGVLVGAYHYAHPEQNSAEDEAAHFLEALNSVNLNLWPVLDLESPPQKNSTLSGDYLAEWSRTFINIVSSSTGGKVILYTGKWYIDMYEVDGLSDLPLWISHYSSYPPPDFAGWAEWLIWQYTDKGTVNGISGQVDMNVVTSLEALQIYLKKKVQINGKPWMDGIVVGVDTYVVWTALKEVKTPFIYKGNGLMNVNGVDVQGVVYNGDTYLPWMCLSKNVQAVPIDGGWNFVVS